MLTLNMEIYQLLFYLYLKYHLFYLFLFMLMKNINQFLKIHLLLLYQIFKNNLQMFMVYLMSQEIYLKILIIHQFHLIQFMQFMELMFYNYYQTFQVLLFLFNHLLHLINHHLYIHIYEKIIQYQKLKNFIFYLKNDLILNKLLI